VYVRFRDPWGNTSDAVSDTIIFDTTAPTNASAVTTTPTTGSVCVSFTPGTDAHSGFASTRAMRAAGTAPTSCAAGTLAWESTGSTGCDTGVTDGTVYGYRLCTVDAAGNRSTGTTFTETPRPETTAPTGTVSAQGGATWTRSRSVTLALSASDESGVSTACASEASTCTSYATYAATRSFSLGTAQGTHTVNVWFKDAWGNVSSPPASDSIGLDSVAPVVGTINATGSDSRVDLSWSGFTDATSGIASYTLVGSTTTTPSCSGTPLYSGSDTSFAHTALTNGTEWSYALCAVDSAGNTSAVVRASARPAPEYTLPTGTFTLADGASWTATRSVTATLAATDDTAVTSMCLSSSASCTAWVSYASTVTATLPTGSGTKTVNAWFRDTWGNVSAMASDTIGLDVTAPTNGTVTATAGSGEVALSWSGFADAHSGLVSYRVAGSTAAPANCSTESTLLWSGTDTSWTDTGRPAGTMRYYRVCAVDAVGNVSSGATKSATPL
jgi:hypothetical protein